MKFFSRKPPWYAAGLAFECRQCGRCCAGPVEGYVWVSDPEITRIAAKLGIDVQEVRTRYVRKVGRRQSLKECSGNNDCIFLKADGSSGRGCVIYDVRPMQCRTWPFWPSNLTSPEDWSLAQVRCRGINFGRRHDYEEIEVKRNDTQE